MSRTNAAPSGTGRRDILAFLILVSIVILVWWFAWRWIDSNIGLPLSNETHALRGQFGDKFGAINALFSGLAFAGIIFTVLLQKRELSLQREELEKNRQNLEEQTRNLGRQRFEDMFFNLLKLHSEITKDLDLPGHPGRRAHDYLFQHFANSDQEFNVFISLHKLSRERVRKLQEEKQIDEANYPELDQADISTIVEALTKQATVVESYLDRDESMHAQKIKRAYEKTCLALLDDFAHYFRNFYHTLRFIDDSKTIDNSEKKAYARILRSQLSDIELVSLFYNSIMPYKVAGREMELGYPKLGRLLVRYDILQNMSKGLLVHDMHLAIFQKNNKTEVL